jgi:hypothetical protein
MELIRKIIVGSNPKDAMAYFIGMRAGEGQVSAIVFDERNYMKYSTKCYDIYIETEEGTMKWKRIEEMPTILEYDCRF